MAQVTLLHGDCLEEMRTLDTNSVDAVVTDPPYGMSLVPQRGRTKAIVGDGREEAQALWRAVLPECYRVAKPDTAHVFFSRWSEPWVKDVLAEHFTVKGCIVWKKNVWGIGYYLRPQHEFAWYCHKGKPPKPTKAGSDVWEFAREHRPIHSCQKPVPLMERAIELCLDGRMGVVMDPFMGVGSTGVAAANMGLPFIGIELAAEHFAVAQARINEAKAEPSEPDLFSEVA